MSGNSGHCLCMFLCVNNFSLGNNVESRRRAEMKKADDTLKQFLRQVCLECLSDLSGMAR